MELTFAAEAPPLTVDAGGAVRVGGTRVTLEMVIAAHRRGLSAEQIAERYETLAVGDVYAVLGYYFRHRAAVDAYMDRCDAEAAGVRRQVEERQGPQPPREVWLARLEARRGG